MARSYESAKRVVITGVGIFSPLGIGFEPFAANLLAGKSTIGRLETVAFSGSPNSVGAEIKDFNEATAKNEYLKKQRKSIKVMCREIQFGVASASLAIEHARLDLGGIDHERFGVEFGANLMFSPPEVLKDACWTCVEPEDPTWSFQYDMWGGKGLRSLEPLWLLRYLPNMPACHIGIYADARGPSNSITLNEASGNLAISEAYHVIQRDLADVMIAGTTGTKIHAVKSMHAALWDVLAEHGDDPPSSWSRPFEKSRTGEVIAEGACCLILEEETHALREAYHPGTRAGGRLVLCLRPERTRLCHASPGQRDAHGHSRRRPDAGADWPHQRPRPGNAANGPRRSAGHPRSFRSESGPDPGNGAEKLSRKRGHSCGTIELAGSLAGLKEGVVPPTLNYRVPDPDCRLNIVGDKPQPIANRIVLNVNVTTMGQASAWLSKPPDRSRPAPPSEKPREEAAIALPVPVPRERQGSRRPRRDGECQNARGQKLEVKRNRRM